MLEYDEQVASEDYSRKCKPDYESMIKKCTEKRDRYKKFKEAMFEFIGRDYVREKMAELLGELVSHERRYNAEIEELIKRQEEDKD